MYKDGKNTTDSTAAPRVSFEFFPPKTAEMEDQLWHCINRLKFLSPEFVSVTYGAGGGTRERTHNTVTRILRETRLQPAAHLTCVGASRAEIDAIARNYYDNGIRHIVALRGDPPAAAGGAGDSSYHPHPDGYGYAVDLVAGLKRLGDFEISVAAYPEGHPAARSLEDDLDWLKRKIDAGASRAITQYFFDNSVYERFLERAVRAGITVPIVPGILPVTNFAQVIKFSAACGASIPPLMARMFEGLDAEPETRRLMAAMLAADQVLELRRLGVQQFHFYTLNRADLVYAICRRLGIAEVRVASRG
ncbi:MAG: methylenetetrahydrofolate reductase [NAD(P)H] [Candidatus Pacebacteria bacterium]|nr:methylenetetrahydrofolate reductase [NAD(P)H] [Candidatus Paceibacterota bacterium]